MVATVPIRSRKRAPTAATSSTIPTIIFVPVTASTGRQATAITGFDRRVSPRKLTLSGSTQLRLSDPIQANSPLHSARIASSCPSLNRPTSALPVGLILGAWLRFGGRLSSFPTTVSRRHSLRLDERVIRCCSDEIPSTLQVVRSLDRMAFLTLPVNLRPGPPSSRSPWKSPPRASGP